MSTTLIATLGGLWAMCIWGSVNWLLGRQSKKLNAVELNAVQQIGGITVITLILLLTKQHVPSIHLSLIIGTACIFFSLAFVSFLKALSIGATGLVTPTASTYPLFTLVFSAPFVALSFTRLQVLSMLVITSGIIILAYERRRKRISLVSQHRATVFALSAAVLWGIGNVIQNSVIDQTSWQSFLWILDVWLTLFAFILFFALKPKQFFTGVKNIFHRRNVLLTGGTYTIGSAGFYYSSVKVGSIIIPLVVSSASPLVASVLSAKFDHEKLTLAKRVGAVVVVAGIILLNLN